MNKFTYILCTVLTLMLLGVSGSLLAQSWQWAVAPLSAGAGSSTITATTLDNAGNTVVAGNFSGTLTLGGFTLVSAGTQDLFVARISNAGVWLAVTTAQATGSGSVAPTVLACQANGEVIVGGSFSGTTVRFGNTTLTNSDVANPTTYDLFVARLSSAGQWTQAVRAGGPKGETIQSLLVDAAGNIVVGGGFAGQQCRFGTFSLNNVDTGPYPSLDIFVARLSAAGKWTQAVGLGSGGGEYVTGMAFLSDGTVAVTGEFNSYVLQFGTTPLLYNSGYYAGAYTYATLFVARLNPAGTWVSAFGTYAPGAVHPQALVADQNGDVVIAGYFSSSTVRFGSTPVLTNTNPNSDGFVARLNGLTGTPSWTQATQCGAVGFDKINTLALDAAGNAIVTGSFTGATTRFGSIVLTNTTTASPDYNPEDIFVARLSRAGSWTHALQAGGTSYDIAHGATIDAQGQTLVVGTAVLPAAFGSIALAGGTSGKTSGFVARVGGLPLATAPQRSIELLAIAPNPATTTVTVTLPSEAQPRLLHVVDALGRNVRSQVVPAHGTSVVLNVAGLHSGLYVVHCGSGAARFLIE